MALVPCRECGQQISSQAPTCPKCGHPNSTPGDAASNSPPPKKSRVWIWVLLVPVAFFLVLASVGPPAESPERFAARKMECSKALMSSMNHSTRNYTDKQAYDQHVREKCAGLEINGTPLDR